MTQNLAPFTVPPYTYPSWPAWWTDMDILVFEFGDDFSEPGCFSDSLSTHLKSTGHESPAIWSWLVPGACLGYSQTCFAKEPCSVSMLKTVQPGGPRLSSCPMLSVLSPTELRSENQPTGRHHLSTLPRAMCEKVSPSSSVSSASE